MGLLLSRHLWYHLIRIKTDCVVEIDAIYEALMLHCYHILKHSLVCIRALQLTRRTICILATDNYTMSFLLPIHDRIYVIHLTICECHWTWRWGHARIKVSHRGRHRLGWENWLTTVKLRKLQVLWSWHWLATFEGVGLWVSWLFKVFVVLLSRAHFSNYRLNFAGLLCLVSIIVRCIWSYRLLSCHACIILIRWFLSLLVVACLFLFLRNYTLLESGSKETLFANVLHRFPSDWSSEWYCLLAFLVINNLDKVGLKKLTSIWSACFIWIETLVDKGCHIDI